MPGTPGTSQQTVTVMVMVLVLALALAPAPASGSKQWSVGCQTVLWVRLAGSSMGAPFGVRSLVIM